MSSRFGSILGFLLIPFLLNSHSPSKIHFSSSYPYGIQKPDLVSNISVRESTTELQIAVGKSIFVFTKTGGTLDKVKVGMNLLNFGQVPGIVNIQSTLSKVSWKRLKDGSIQIKSSYIPNPMALTWTVFLNGQLKMEAAMPSVSTSFGWLGLGFNFPENQLSQVSWHEEKSNLISNEGFWKNVSYTQTSDSELEIDQEVKGLFQQIQSAKFEFESVTVDVRTETSSVFLNLAHPENQDSSYPKIGSNLAFLINQSATKSEDFPKNSSEQSTLEQTVSPNPLVLWFHFQ